MEKRCCRTEERCLKKKVTLSEHIRLCMKKFFLSSWLREEGKVKEERLMEMDKEIEEETSKNKTREEGKEEKRVKEREREKQNDRRDEGT